MFSIKSEARWIKISIIALISIFFIINLYSALRYGNGNYLGSFERFENDDVKYIRSAWELVENGHFIYHRVDEPTVFIMPGLSFVIAFFVEIFGKYDGIAAFRIFQALLQCMSMYLIFLIGRKIFNNKVALIACIIDLLYVTEYYVTTIVLTEVIFKFLLLLLIYISIYAIEKKKVCYYIAGGIVWGLACLVRPTIAIFPVIILIMWIREKYSFKDIVKFTLITTLVFSIVMSPWWIRNYYVFNRFIPLTLSSGNPFLQGTYINYDSSIGYIPYESDRTAISAIEVNENEMRTGLYRLKIYAAKEPAKYALWYTFGKFRYLWAYPFYWKDILGVSFAIATLFHYIILLLGIIGTIKLLVTKHRSFIFPFLTVIFFSLIYLPYYTMPRYSYPIMPIVFLTASIIIYEILVIKRNKLNQSKDLVS